MVFCPDIFCLFDKRSLFVVQLFCCPCLHQIFGQNNKEHLSDGQKISGQKTLDKKKLDDKTTDKKKDKRALPPKIN